MINKMALKQAYFISFFVALILALCSLVFGYTQVFIALNFNGGKIVDIFFTYITYFGDGWIWLLVAAVAIIQSKKNILLVVSTAAISTIIAQTCKLLVFNNQPRPVRVILDKTLYHTIDGVYLNEVGSFPSGHTTSAFCIYFLACILFPKKSVVYAGFIITLIVAYSRVYQAQHFPIDVAGGIIAAICSVYIALLINKRVIKQ